jgi:hypothetical protein
VRKSNLSGAKDLRWRDLSMRRIHATRLEPIVCRCLIPAIVASNVIRLRKIVRMDSRDMNSVAEFDHGMVATTWEMGSSRRIGHKWVSCDE